MTKAVLVLPDNSVDVIDFDANDYPTLRDVVGGHLEIVRSMTNQNVHGYVNEEGKIEHLPFNRIATFLTGAYPNDIIVGPCVFLGPGEDGTEADIVPGWTVKIPETRLCAFCREDGESVAASVDAKTSLGPWADMCGDHFAEYGIGLGTGLGQVYYTAPYVAHNADQEDTDGPE